MFAKSYSRERIYYICCTSYGMYKKDLILLFSPAVFASVAVVVLQRILLLVLLLSTIIRGDPCSF